MPARLPDLEGGQSLAVALSQPGYRAELEARLPEFLDERRWFANRGGQLTSVRLEEFVPVTPDGSIAVGIVAVDQPGHRARYQLPLLAAPAGGVVDALDTPAGASAFASAILGPLADARLTVTRDPALAIDGPPWLFRGEQSNSSVVFGEAAILKLFRQLSPGRNPDVEIPAWLAREGGFANVPATLASGRLDLPGWSADSFVIQQFVPNEGDGWAWATRLAEAARAAVAEGGTLDAWLESPAGAELLENAAALGDVTARLHLALASARTPGLQPAPFTPADRDDVANGIRADIDVLLTPGSGLTAGAVASLRGLLHLPPGSPGDLGWRTRVHGDYHLGQVLKARTGWVIVDFEGEPARPLQDRVALQHPLVDVAGMVRSWDYAGAVAAGPAIAQAWATAASDAFLHAYRVRAAGAPFLPDRDESVDSLIRLFTLRKALYELRYELGSRPAWAGIPLAALARMAEGR